MKRDAGFIQYDGNGSLGSLQCCIIKNQCSYS